MRVSDVPGPGMMASGAVRAVGCGFVAAVTLMYLVMVRMKGRYWEGWAPATCMPLNCFCERVHDGLVRQPVNTWTNIPFAIAGVGIMCWADSLVPKEAWKASGFRIFTLLFGMSTCGLALGSFFFHASLVFVGQWVDNLGMAMIVVAIVANVLHRRGKLEEKHMVPFYVVVNAVLGVALALIPPFRRQMFFVCILVLGYLECWDNLLRQRMARTVIGEDDKPKHPLHPEIRRIPSRRHCRRNDKGTFQFLNRSNPIVQAATEFTLYVYHLQYLQICTVLMALAFAIWILDIKHMMCWPDSVFQGHGVWHFMNAVAVCFAYYHEVRSTRTAVLLHQK